MLKPNDNPPIRPKRVSTVEELDGPWWVAHTKARHEKAFAWELVRLGIDHYLPMTQRVRISGGKKRRVYQPLFPSYVFFCGDREDRYRAMTTNRLCQVIEAPEPRQFADELTAVDRAMRSGADLGLYEGLPAGTPARITAGAFKGTEGTVVEWSDAAHLVLQVSMLGRGVVLEIEPDLVEPLAPEVEIRVGGVGAPPPPGRTTVSGRSAAPRTTAAHSN